MAKKTKDSGHAKPIQLSFRSEQRVVVTSPDNHLFFMTAKEAASACRSALDEKDWLTEFNEFLAHIHEWAKQHSDDIESAYVGISSEGLTVVLITKGDEYRFDLDDEVSDLDIELAKRHPNVKADVLHSPECEPETRVPYLSQERALQVYGNQNGSQGES